MLSRVHELLVGLPRYVDALLATLVALVLAALIIPLPAWALDLGLAVSLASSAALLVSAVFAKSVLESSAFPTLLLLGTMLRLSLSVSSTRLALADGSAGRIIAAFGEFVVRGEYVVGAVVYAILAVVQFLVVAKGAERVAEVSARFSLDAMPGKQMSIDADLRSGAIGQTEARARRRDLERESQLFGAMDGAMKFVKGDVVASFLIVLVNFLGGTALGVLQEGVPLGEAARTYALLAIGDGLVSQVPSLCVAVAAGLLVTRVASPDKNGALGQQIAVQLFGDPQPLVVVGGLLALFAALPGMPSLAFLLLGGLFLAAAGYLVRRKRTQPENPAGHEPEEAGERSPVEKAGRMGPAVLVALGEGLSPAPGDDGKELRALFEELRVRLFQETGVPVPVLSVRPRDQALPPGGFEVWVEDVPAGTGRIAKDRLYAQASKEELRLAGVEGRPLEDPFGRAEVWEVEPVAEPLLARACIPFWMPFRFLSERLFQILRRRAAEFLGIQAAQDRLDDVARVAPALVKEVLAKVPLPLLTEVLRKLVEEEVSVRNLQQILEALVAPATEGTASDLAEHCRRALRRQLTHQYALRGVLYSYLVDPCVEELFRAGNHGATLAPEQAAGILESARKIACERRAVVLSSPEIRRKLRKLCESAFPDLVVLTYAELSPEVQIRPLGRLAVASPMKSGT